MIAFPENDDENSDPEGASCFVSNAENSKSDFESFSVASHKGQRTWAPQLAVQMPPRLIVLVIMAFHTIFLCPKICSLPMLLPTRN